MHRRAIYYQGRLVRLVRGKQAIEAAQQGAPLLVFNEQKGWVRGGSGALQRAEQAIAEGWWQAVSYYGALVDVSPTVQNPRVDSFELQVFIADSLPRDIDAQIVQFMGRQPDRVFPAPKSLSPLDVDGRILIFAELSQEHVQQLAGTIAYHYRGERRVRVYWSYSDRFRKKRVKYKGGRPMLAKEDHRSISQHVHWTLGRYGYVGVGQVTGDVYTITPTYIGVDRFEFKLRLAAYKDDPFRGGKALGHSTYHKKLMLKADRCEGKSSRVAEVENPWTPPGALWPRYELKIMPAESYMHAGKRIIHKWRVVMWTFDPDSPRPIETEVGFARNSGDAEDVAFKYADKLHDKEPRNPNDIRVFNDQGRCIWSLQGLC